MPLEIYDGGEVVVFTVADTVPVRHLFVSETCTLDLDAKGDLVSVELLGRAAQAAAAAAAAGTASPT